MDQLPVPVYASPVPRHNPHIKPYCRARKYLRSDAQWINVPNEVATDLVRKSRSAVIANLDLYQQVNGCYALPRMRVQEMLEVIDRCIEGIPYVPMDEAMHRLYRGLGNMVAFWERMRNICPKVNSYYGPVAIIFFAGSCLGLSRAERPSVS